MIVPSTGDASLDADGCLPLSPADTLREACVDVICAAGAGRGGGGGGGCGSSSSGGSSFAELAACDEFYVHAAALVPRLEARIESSLRRLALEAAAEALFFCNGSL